MNAILNNPEINNYANFHTVFPGVIEIINNGLAELQEQLQQRVTPLIRNNPWLDEGVVAEMFLNSQEEAIFEDQCSGKYSVVYKAEYEDMDNIKIVIAAFDHYSAAKKFIEDLINYSNQFKEPESEEEWNFYDIWNEEFEKYPMWKWLLEIKQIA